MILRGQTHEDVQIVGYDGGMIEYRTSHGDFDKASIMDIDSLNIDSVDAVLNLNKAEAFLREERPRKAVERYEKALRGAKNFWAPLIRARLIQAADESYLFEKAVRNWLKVAHRDQATAALLMPRFLPDELSPSTRRVLKKLERTIDRSNSQKERALLQMLRFETLRRLNDPAALVLAGPLMKLAVKTEMLMPRAADILVGAGDLLIENGASTQVLKSVEAAIVEAPEESLPTLLLLKSRAVFAGAETADDYLSAALPAMRVVIHFPSHPLAGDGLILAARAHAASDRPDEAKRLLDACMALDHATAKTKTQAAQLLESIGNERQRPSDKPS